MNETTPEHLQPQTAEQAYEQQYQELTDVIARVINKVKDRHDSNSEKTWPQVGDLQHITEVMNELDEFLGN